ncbi:MAG: hypothetical protein MJZ50_04085 [Treponema sp.]|nr:hypothetical protein [Treponema sp.]
MWVKRLAPCILVLAFNTLFFSCSSSYDEDEELEQSRNLGNRFSFCVSGDYIDIHGIKGMDICYVNLNTSSTTPLARENISDMAGIVGIESGVPDGIVLFNSTQDARTVTSGAADFYGDALRGTGRAAPPAGGTIPADPVVDATKVDFYLAKNSQNETDIPDLVGCTLRAKVKGTSRTFLVWVPEASWTLGKPSGIKINGAVARDIAQKFSSLYDEEVKVYGTESGTMFNYETKATAEFAATDMDCINIIVYDIDGDGNSKNASSSMIGGFFSQRDYFINDGTSVTYSNQAKIIYLDSLLCNYNGDTELMSARAYSTLAHELVHLITFAKKYGGNTKTSSANKWFNEMLAMMAEDMFSQGIHGSDGNAAANERMGSFNSRYYMMGTATFNSADTSNLGYYYSSNFAFGAWLARNYGGVGFVSDLAQSSEYGMGAVLNSVSRISGEKFTRDFMLVEQFIQSCVVRNSFAAANSIPSFYRSYPPSGPGSLSPSFGLIDLYSREHSFQLSSFDGRRVSGPMIVSPGTKPVQLGPLGFIVSYVGRASDEYVRIYFSRGKSSAEEIIVIVQDPFSNQVR